MRTVAFLLHCSPSNTGSGEGVNCGIHGWMKGFIWVFDNPYFAVTDADGKFEIKNAPSGPVNLVVWQEEAGYGEGGKNGKTIQINPDITTDLPAIGIKAE